MIYFGYPLDIHGWKIKPETEPDWFRGPNPKTVGEKPSPNLNPRNPKSTDMHPKPNPLPSLCTPPVTDERKAALPLFVSLQRVTVVRHQTVAIFVLCTAFCMKIQVRYMKRYEASCSTVLSAVFIVFINTDCLR